jgi:hypothetical protein
MNAPLKSAALLLAGAASRRAACGLALAWLALVAPAAWASYAQMRLDGLTFLLVVVFLYWWGVPLAITLAMGWCRRTGVALAMTGVTAALVWLLIVVFDDGRATLQQRPLTMWGMFVVLLLVSVPAMLAAPFLQLAWRARSTPSRLPVALLVGALALPAAGSVAYLLLQEHLERRAHDQALALAPGRLLPHVIAVRQRAAGAWLNPYWWNEDAELAWTAHGIGSLGFIESPVPISADDTQALELLVKQLAVPGKPDRTWKLGAKLVWDRLMRAAPDGRFAVAASLTEQQARQFALTIGLHHVDWFCAPLADPETARAFGHVWTLLPPDNDKQRLMTAIEEKCGRSGGVPAT